MALNVGAGVLGKRAAMWLFVACILSLVTNASVLAQSAAGASIGGTVTDATGQLLVPKYLSPDAEWFGPSPAAARDKALLAALVAAVNDLTNKAGEDSNNWQWGKIHSATFRHMLGSDVDLQKLLNVSPFPRAGYGNTPFATGGRGFEQNTGASYREVLDVADWDRSIATSAPGQSGQPGSPRFDDLAKLWAAHTYFPLSFGGNAVSANAEATLMLAPHK